MGGEREEGGVRCVAAFARSSRPSPFSPLSLLLMRMQRERENVNPYTSFVRPAADDETDDD